MADLLLEAPKRKAKPKNVGPGRDLVTGRIRKIDPADMPTPKVKNLGPGRDPVTGRIRKISPQSKPLGKFPTQAMPGDAKTISPSASPSDIFDKTKLAKQLQAKGVDPKLILKQTGIDVQAQPSQPSAHQSMPQINQPPDIPGISPGSNKGFHPIKNFLSRRQNSKFAKQLGLDPKSIEKREKVLKWSMQNYYKSYKAVMAHQHQEPNLGAWLNAKLPSIAKGDPNFFRTLTPPQDEKDEEKIIDAAVEKALNLTHFWEKKAELASSDPKYSKYVSGNIPKSAISTRQRTNWSTAMAAGLAGYGLGQALSDPHDPHLHHDHPPASIMPQMSKIK